MTKTNKFNNGEFQQVCDCMVVLECMECGNMISASCLAQARLNHENTSLQIQDSNNAEVLLDSGLKLSDIIVMGLRLLSYWKNTWLGMMCCLQIIWQENRKSQRRSWSAAVPHGEDVVQAGCD